jgi:hypothetical protein
MMDMEATGPRRPPAVRVGFDRRTHLVRLVLFAVVATSVVWVLAAPSSAALILAVSSGIAALGWRGEPIRAIEPETE